MTSEKLPRLLVVDDDRSILHYLSGLLKPLGRVLCASSGAEAMKTLGLLHPDLILLDASMPEMDGYAVCSELKGSPSTRDIPIIFVTALNRPEDETRALECGAVDFIQKPFNEAVVLARIRTHLALKQQKDELREAGAKLKESNESLQHFAYLAAHDLQAPLNAIAGCMELLKEDVAGKLSGQGEQTMAHVLDATGRMQQLIRDLLAYSQLDAKTQPLAPTDLRRAVDEVCFILGNQIKAANAEVSCGDLPTVNADRQQINQLLTNLIGNGIKYNQQEIPRIHLSARRDGEQWIVSVQDNGIGIDPQHHQRIFEIFRRLHTSRAYPGSGIGLAMCQRIVARHGGRIWVESHEGSGSTFFFTLPASS